MPARLVALLLPLTVAGCLVHERDGSPDGGGAVDVGHAVDVGTDTNRRAPDDEPPDAWIADGAVPHGVRLTPGDPVSIDDSPTRQGGSPSTVWNGTGWGVAYWGIGVRARLLDALGAPLTSSVVLTEETVAGSLEFGAGRYAAVLPASPTILRVLDDRLGALQSVEIPSDAVHGDVAWLETAHRWMLVVRERSDRAFGDPAPVVVRALDESLGGASESIVLDRAVPGADVRVVSVKTRAVVTWVSNDGLRAAVVRPDPLEQIGPTIDLTPLRSISDFEDMYVEAEPLGREVLIATPTGHNVEVYAVDSFTGSTRGPYLAAATGVADRRVGIAAAPEHGMFAVCWSGGGGPSGHSSDRSHTFSMRVFATDGTPLSDELLLVSGLVNAGGIDCGWNGTDFVVIWWRGEEDNDLFSQPVHATFF